ncbi:hypothetical protein M0802_006477 [Mischocyttarus mexicanus]|nr:hypothetical protein M0802_006477 [Mischocyttarus mexicanus]
MIRVSSSMLEMTTETRIREDTANGICCQEEEEEEDDDEENEDEKKEEIEEEEEEELSVSSCMHSRFLELVVPSNASVA